MHPAAQQFVLLITSDRIKSFQQFLQKVCPQLSEKGIFIFSQQIKQI
jgi:hypothetical protein